MNFGEKERLIFQWISKELCVKAYGYISLLILRKKRRNMKPLKVFLLLFVEPYNKGYLSDRDEEPFFGS